MLFVIKRRIKQTSNSYKSLCYVHLQMRQQSHHRKTYEFDKNSILWFSFEYIWLRPDETKWGQMRPDKARWGQMTPDDARWGQMTPDDARWRQMTPDDTRWDQMTPDKARWGQMTPDEARWHQMRPHEASFGRSPRPPKKGPGPAEAPKCHFGDYFT